MRNLTHCKDCGYPTQTSAMSMLLAFVTPDPVKKACPAYKSRLFLYMVDGMVQRAWVEWK